MIEEKSELILILFQRFKLDFMEPALTFEFRNEAARISSSAYEMLNTDAMCSNACLYNLSANPKETERLLFPMSFSMKRPVVKASNMVVRGTVAKQIVANYIECRGVQISRTKIVKVDRNHRHLQNLVERVFWFVALEQSIRLRTASDADWFIFIKPVLFGLRAQATCWMRQYCHIVTIVAGLSKFYFILYYYADS